MLAFSVGRLLYICDKFADMNEVMFYTLNQIPVTKEDIITGKFEDKMNSSMMANYEKMTVSIPSGRTKAIGKEEIGVPRYNQTNEILWLPGRDAAKYASSIEAGLAEQVLAFAAGFIPNVGWVVALPWGLKLLLQSSIASQIRAFSDDGKGVEITRIISTYGGSMAVKYWNGKSITLLKPKNESSGHMFTKIKVSYSFK